MILSMLPMSVLSVGALDITLAGDGTADRAAFGILDDEVAGATPAVDIGREVVV